MTLQLSTETNQYSLRVPAHRYWQGDRCVYYFPLDLATLDGLLPQRVDEKMVNLSNRQLTPSHARDIKDYLGERRDWLLGSFLLGIADDAVDFRSYSDADGRPNNRFGELRIITNRMNTMRIFDGQHRRRAIADLLLEMHEKDELKEDLEEFRRAAVPIVLYVEEDIKALRQMFSDASKTKAIESNVVAMFDQRDPFNLTVQWLLEQTGLFRGRVETERPSVQRSSHYLLSINQLVSILRTLTVGYTSRISYGRKNEYMQGLETLKRDCQLWADEFLPAAREEYRGLVTGEIEDSEIPKWRTLSFAFNPNFIRIIAGCYRVWCDSGDSWHPLAEYLRSADLSVGGREGALLVDAGVVAAGDNYPIARRQEVQAAINFIVAEARKASG